MTFEHEGNWNKALEYYDLLVRSASVGNGKHSFADSLTSSQVNAEKSSWKFYKGLMRSLQKTGCTHILDVYCHGLTNYSAYLQHDSEFADLQVGLSLETLLYPLFVIIVYADVCDDICIFVLCSMRLLGGLEIGTSH